MICFSLLSVPLLLAQAAQHEWRLRLIWDWSTWTTVLAIIAAAIWVAFFYFQEKSTAGRGIRTVLAGLRLTALALALLMFAQPAVEWFQQGRPRLVLLVDNSASMDTLDPSPQGQAEVSRLASWQKLLTAGKQPLIEQWSSGYQLDVITFNEQIKQLINPEISFSTQLLAFKAADKAPNGGTRLGDVLDYALRELPGEPPVAIVVMTDGIATQGQTLQQAAHRARRLRVPIYTVAIGSDRLRPDIAVENLLVEEVVFPGDRLQVEATIRASGYEGETVEVILQDTAAGVLARTQLKLPADETPKHVCLAIRPDKPGKLKLELFIKPQGDESNTENNFVHQTVEVRDEKIKVLLVQSQPSYEYRALKSLLERDPAVELHVVLQEADADYPSVDNAALAAFPSSEQGLFAYDVLLLGDVDPGLLPRSVWPLVQRFVTDHGGGLVGIAGPRFMPFAFRGIRSLEALLPMSLESLNPLRSQMSGVETYAVTPTALGWRTPSLQLGETSVESQQIWEALPRVSWMLRLEEVKPGAQVLAEHSGQINRQEKPLPVILRHYVGAGEVLFHATDETWRWRWRTDDRYFARYWGQVVRRLGRGRLAIGRQGVQLTSDRSQYEPGETVELRARFRNPAQAPAEDDQLVVQLQGAIGPPHQINLQRRLGRRGLFTATLDDLPPSSYEMQIISPDLPGPAEVSRFEIRQPPRELANVVVNRKDLSEAAEITGGKSYTLANVSRLTNDLPQPQRKTLVTIPPRQLWNTHAILALFVIVLAAEWILRRRYGML